MVVELVGASVSRLTCTATHDGAALIITSIAQWLARQRTAVAHHLHHQQHCSDSGRGEDTRDVRQVWLAFSRSSCEDTGDGQRCAADTTGCSDGEPPTKRPHRVMA